MLTKRHFILVNSANCLFLLYKFAVINQPNLCLPALLLIFGHWLPIYIYIFFFPSVSWLVSMIQTNIRFTIVAEYVIITPVKVSNELLFELLC